MQLSEGCKKYFSAKKKYYYSFRLFHIMIFFIDKTAEGKEK